MIQLSFKVSGNIIDVVSKRIYSGTVSVVDGKIDSIDEHETDNTQYILPGLIDAHIHIESSMMIPSEFARIAVTHGTVATVSDPHEIANVLGVSGVNFMIENGRKVPFKFYFGAPSCVPATTFETSGATIGVKEINELMKRPEIKYLSEMMNFPGVLFRDADVIKKLSIAKRNKRPVDGHAPGLKGEDARKYIEAGITTDHECFTIEEALSKINYGMKILIREGSAAKNFEALAPLIASNPNDIMMCSDDKHPNDLCEGHINILIKRAIQKGYHIINILRACTFNPIKHYKLDVGLLQQGDDADFIVVDNLEDFNVLNTYVKGIKVAEEGSSLIHPVNEEAVNLFNAEKIVERDIRIAYYSKEINVIRALEGQLITESFKAIPKVEKEFIVSDTENDILKIIVMNRYQKSHPVVGFINNFNLTKGAIASTVAHDSHNIIAVGTNDKDIVRAINLLIECKGGISIVNGDFEEYHLPLPVAGLMSNTNGFELAEKYNFLDNKAKEFGSKLNAPFMTLSFMALLVIPKLKISDKGLFDGVNFKFTSVYS